jgi:hypothetical protein
MIVSDVRFGNEARALRKRGATIVRVMRDTGLPADEDDSERHVNEIRADLVIENNGTIEELYDELAKTFVPVYGLDFYKRK